ncbi:hypothetical protein H8B15_02270 [Hymenobacter sp. BT507]|uniref:Uncharacterized protein n=1 Tax=Hymenobacter citatus TaxID=2763506 RepID=A0ABR7MG70_9BACT|nr:hypothetical protein [Hymenobacter citatus]MBC6609730.1 hypothetical protein [Hymenobacter citatus]
MPALLLSACEPQLEDPTPAAASNDSSIRLKKDKRNPFSMAVMREAVRNLRLQKAVTSTTILPAGKQTASSNVVITDEPCEGCDPSPGPGEGGPTHYYVRLKPSDVNQLADLADLGVNLSLVLLNEDVAANYQVPETDEIPWLYTAIPSDYILPQNIQQERLEDLFLYNADDADAQDIDPWEPEPTDCYGWDPACNCYVSCSTISNPPTVAEHSPNKKATANRPATSKPKRNRVKEATAYLRQLGIAPAALYAEAMRITGHEEELLPASLGRPATGRQLTIDTSFPSLAKTAYTASGTIRVEDYYRTNAGLARRNVPLVNVWVEARRWFKQDGAFTNNGQFFINTNFRQKAHVLVRFKNNQLTTRGNSAVFKPWLSVLPIQHDLGMYTGTQMQGLSYLFTYQADADSKGALSWTAATLFNSRAEMQTYTAARNIPAPPNGLNVFLSSDITKAASAPMLRRIAETSYANRIIDATLVGSGLAGLAIIKQVLQRQLPDITCRFGGVKIPGSSARTPTRTSDDLQNTFYHELAHTIHYNQVGNTYWTFFIGRILSNTSGNATYGFKTDSGAEQIAVSEGWAYYIGESFAIEKYRAISPLVIDEAQRKLEGQRPLNGSSDYENWIIYGLYHDMTDTGEPTGTGVVDNVNTYTAAQIFDALRSDVLSVRQFQNKILPRNGYQQSPEVEQLITSYLY